MTTETTEASVVTETHIVSRTMPPIIGPISRPRIRLAHHPLVIGGSRRVRWRRWRWRGRVDRSGWGRGGRRGGRLLSEGGAGECGKSKA